jgi:hypothetical protein
MDPIKAQLEQAGYTNVVAIRKGRWYTATKNNDPCAILYQHDNAWHWFHAVHQATASGSSASQAANGGLGDAISDDDDMKQYKRMIRQTPPGILDLAGVFAAYCQVQNDN